MIVHPYKAEKLALYGEILAITELLISHYKKTQDGVILGEIQHFYEWAEEYKKEIDTTTYPHMPTATLDFHQ